MRRQLRNELVDQFAQQFWVWSAQVDFQRLLAGKITGQRFHDRVGLAIDTGSGIASLGGAVVQSETAAVYRAMLDAALAEAGPQRILVLKLDHLGDFLIGVPALKQLRELFPGAQITLICGSWNVPTAQKLGVADDVRTFDYFPENTQDWDGQVAKDTVDRDNRLSLFDCFGLDFRCGYFHKAFIIKV